MATPLSYLQQRQGEDWLINHSSQAFFTLTETYCQILANRQAPTCVLLADPEPLRFLAGLMAACITNTTIALGNPDWGESEWQQAIALVQPDLVWGREATGARERIGRREETADRGQAATAADIVLSDLFFSASPKILIPTGGSSGRLRFAIHTWETLLAAVQGFQDFFGVAAVNSCCVLPLYHVSGLMQFLRSLTSGGKLAVLPFKALGASQLSQFHPADFFLSLVPTQLDRLLTAGSGGWLGQFQTVLLGGAPAWSSLLETARQAKIRLAPTYGMTETAAQVATLKADDFLEGRRGYCCLPHAQVTICNALGDRLGANQVGNIKIQAASLALGYLQANAQGDVKDGVVGEAIGCTDDLGYLDTQGYLHLVGRASDKIITGGENVFPSEVEAALQATGLVQDVAVIGLADAAWGEAVTALYVPKGEISGQGLKAALQATLSKFKQPKHWIMVQALPRNAQGKVNRSELRALALANLAAATAATSAQALPLKAVAAESLD